MPAVPAEHSLVILSRLLVIGIQFVANHLVPDHDAGVFVSPLDVTVQSKPLDTVINALFGGFARWDAQYYLHIAEHGYTYENSLAFYPLLPAALNVITRTVHLVPGMTSLVSFHELLLLVAVAVNMAAFVMASRALGRLTELVFKNDKIARSAVLLFAINPASVFFTAPYSESLFAWLTFSTMELCQRKCYWHAVLPLCLSIACRSNGTINCGFFVFHILQDALALPGIGRHIVRLIGALTAAALTFAAIQYYQYGLFCVDHRVDISPVLRQYAAENGLVLAGEFAKSNSSWCYSAVPMPYAFVQKHYWNVGLLAYYEVKQIPNFLLATPILGVFLCGAFAFARRQCAEIRRTPVHLYHLFRHQRTIDQRLFVYVVHAALLTAICVCIVHIQVSTRLLASASPCLYWFCARKWDGAFRWPEFVAQNRWLCAWFGGYLVIGTVLFSNFLPWT